MTVSHKIYARFDQEFENEKLQLLATCRECSWEGTFQNYLV